MAANEKMTIGGVEYEFEVYVNGELRLVQSGVSEFAGFRTIVLDKYIPLKTGEKFKVVFKSNVVPYLVFSRQHYLPNVSMANYGLMLQIQTGQFALRPILLRMILKSLTIMTFQLIMQVENTSLFVS